MFGSTASGRWTTSSPASLAGPLALPAGEYTLAITAADAKNADNPAIGPVDVQLEAGGNYTAVANLDAEGKPAANLFTNDVSTIDAGKGKLTVRHTAAAPAVDVLAGGSAVIQGLSNPDEQTLTLDPGTISATVAAAGTTEPVIGPADVPVAEGTHTIVYAWGSLDDGNLAVAVQNIEGLRLGSGRSAGRPVRSGRRSRPGLHQRRSRRRSCPVAPRRRRRRPSQAGGSRHQVAAAGFRSRWCLPGAPPASSAP